MLDWGMERKAYPSDVSDDEWAFVAPCVTLMTEDAPQRTHHFREGVNGAVHVAIGARYHCRPQGPLAPAEHGKKLFARRCHRRSTYQPAERGCHEPAPPLVL
jgi:hypothetical protein